ncbi:hypothetical protein EMIHUDRAFT_195549 [Emiliania huxleyi CCMP1516]|uniref:EF-hand domain-containing protein n=2 Tax=Emiliania huxleyi TaxID=2903 RepID=A0A0D3JHP2_EMIH1|nr:hypothetical protein EMIHUDRAFT_195549 [Emiliania huxleyi CCMP1516]EOD23027.1 hypothetical protein EMIHUDRAFT_195549 [Emiliania huxleyi CCMP1516]|eukprot:XP_005775456.1 hypothetical protein EMIHUDRAFT_195549 [Emiliania huxleyi CCMP1516]
MSAGPRSDGYVKPSLAKKPSSARVSPKASTKAFYVKPRSDGYVKPAAAAAEAKAAKAANKAAKREKQLEDLEALFETLDLNQSGSLSLDEFQQFLESIQCKHTRKQVRAAMKQAKARRGLSRAAEVALTAAMKPPRELKEVVLRHTTSRLYRQRRTQRRAAGDVVDPAAMERALLKLLSEAKFEELLKSDMCKAGGVERAGFGAAIRMARNGQKPKKVPPLPQGKQHLDVGKRDNMLLLLVDIMDPEGNDAMGISAFSLLYLPPLDGGARMAAHFAEISAYRQTFTKLEFNRETFNRLEFMRFALRELKVFSDAEFYHLVTQIRQRPAQRPWERKKSLEQFATLEEIRCGELAQTEKMREDMATIDALVRAQLCLLRGWKVDEEGAKAMEEHAEALGRVGGALPTMDAAERALAKANVLMAKALAMKAAAEEEEELALSV